MTRDPFEVEGPAFISFSGGRTSGYMLRRILDAYGGKLPSNIHVLFSNTGDELPPTLDFVRDCADRWDVPITWVEYYLTPDDEPSYEIVSYNSASRDGEPFDRYLQHVERITAAKGNEPYLPGPGNRFCTTELKIRVMKKWMMAYGYEYWTNIVGIRADEPKRWRKINKTPPERWEVDLPLVDAGVTVEDVRAFWSRQDFDLGIAGDWEGNCDACHLKMPWKVARVFRDWPERAQKWLAREARAGKTFRPRGPSIEQLVQLSKKPIVVEDDGDEIKCTACTD
jgi:3'-phosphoadenosine 5'-phosphosulfate sulfotransferase (PAPS reductase)/FAD synthetase